MRTQLSSDAAKLDAHHELFRREFVVTEFSGGLWIHQLSQQSSMMLRFPSAHYKSDESTPDMLAFGKTKH